MPQLCAFDNCQNLAIFCKDKPILCERHKDSAVVSLEFLDGINISIKNYKELTEDYKNLKGLATELMTLLDKIDIVSFAMNLIVAQANVSKLKDYRP
jgi:hypothetical protein